MTEEETAAAEAASAAHAADPFNIEGDDWSTLVHEKYPDNTIMGNTKSLNDAIDQFQNGQRLLGKDRNPTPQDDWGDDDWTAHYDRLGRPTTAEEYKMEKPITLDGNELDADSLKTINTGLHALGLNGKQYEGTMTLFESLLEGSSASVKEAQDTALAAAETALKAQLGDKYEGERTRADNLLQEMVSPEYYKEIGDSGLGNDARFVNMMIKIAGHFSDDTALGESLDSNLSVVNKALNEISEMKEDELFGKKLMNEENPGHKQAVERWQNAHKRAYPEKK